MASQDSADPILAYVAQSATSRGIDPNVAFQLFHGESGLDPAARGDGNSSFGIPQLHYGGISPSAPHAGLGDAFTKDTGLDARNPANWKQTIDYALDHAKSNGWSAWANTRDKLGMSNFTGIDRNAVPDLLSTWGAKPSGAPGAPPAAAAPIEDFLGAWKSAPPAASPASASPYGILVPVTPRASAGPLANSPDDTVLSSFGKNVATGIVKGAGDIPGFVGNTSNLADYFMARAESAITGKPLEQVQAEHTNALAQMRAKQTPIGRFGNALDPRNVMPSGADIYQPWLAKTGQYVPETEAGRMLQGGVEAAIGAAGPGLGGRSALSPFIAATNVGMGAIGTGVHDATGDPLLAMGAGLAMPAALGAGGRAINALAGRIPPETAALADVARNKYNIPVTATQMSGSPGIQIAGSALNRLPLSGAAGHAAEQQGAFNRAITNTIGEDAAKVTPAVMSAAKSRIGNDFDTVAANTTIKADPQFQTGLRDAMTGAAKELSAAEMTPLDSISQNIASKISPTGEIDGSVYQALTRKGTPLARAIDSPNPNVAHWAGEIRSLLDDALQRSAPPDMQSLLKQARGQYRNLKTIEPLVAKSTTGDVSPALLQGRVNTNSGNAMAYGGGGDLGELARIGQKFLKEPGSSNTAERVHTYGLLDRLGQLATGAGGAAIGINALGIPSMTPAEIALAAGSIPASALLARGMGSALRSDWLANNLIAKSLGRPYQPSGASALLLGAVPPYALQSAPSNALAVQGR